MNSLLLTLPQLIVLILSLPFIGKLSMAMKLIVVQVAFSLLVDLLAYFSVHFWTMSNEFIYNIYMVVEFVLIGSAIYYSIQNQVVKKIILISLFALPIFAAFSYFRLNFMEFNHIVLVLSFLLLSAYNLLYLIVPDYRNSTASDPMIWVCIGHVIYFLGVTPYFAGREFMINSRPDLADELFSYINLVLVICRYLFIGIGLITLYSFKSQKKRLHD
jgi:hypothetical protein